MSSIAEAFLGAEMSKQRRRVARRTGEVDDEDDEDEEEDGDEEDGDEG